MALSADDLRSLDLPPLADIQGKASLESARLPLNFTGVPEQILQGLQAGKRLFFLLMNGQDKKEGAAPKSKWRTARGQSESGQSYHLEISAELYQLIHRGMEKDPRFDELCFLCPDDRIDEPYSQQYKELVSLSRTMEETGGDSQELVKKISQRLYGDEKQRRALVVVLTPEVAHDLGQDPIKLLVSKLPRVFGANQTLVMNVQPNQKIMYVDWEKYIVDSTVHEFQKLLQEAAANPKPAEGDAQRTMRGYPERWLDQSEQYKVLREILQRMQAQLWSACGSVLITGHRGIGKTTLIAAAHQLAQQVGFDTRYARWSDDNGGRAGIRDFDAVFRELIVDWRDSSRDIPIADTLVCIDQAEYGVFNGRNAPVTMEKREKPFRADPGNLLLKKIALQTRVLMTSNQSPAQIHSQMQANREKYQRMLPGSSRMPSTLEDVFGSQTECLVVQPKAPPLTYREFANRLFPFELPGKDWAGITMGTHLEDDVGEFFS